MIREMHGFSYLVIYSSFRGQVKIKANFRHCSQERLQLWSHISRPEMRLDSPESRIPRNLPSYLALACMKISIFRLLWKTYYYNVNDNDDECDTTHPAIYLPWLALLWPLTRF